MNRNEEGSSNGGGKKERKSVKQMAGEKVVELAGKAVKAAAKGYKDHKDKGKVKPYDG